MKKWISWGFWRWDRVLVACLGFGGLAFLDISWNGSLVVGT